MKILYGFSNCSYRKYNELFSEASVMILQQAQKYHSLMCKGIVNNGVEIEAISGLPVNRSLTKSLIVKGGKDEENGVKYHYFTTLNLPGFRQLILFLKAFFRTLFRKRFDVAVADILNISIIAGMWAGCRLRRKPIAGIVTDVPGKLSTDKNTIQGIDAAIMKRMDGYILLTDAMNEIVNPRKRPYIVVEGQVDSSADSKTLCSTKDTPRVLMYAGTLNRIYGIERLTKAFIEADVDGWELHIYGDGDFREELEKICEKYPSIKYKGIKLNDEIVEAEMRASLLVNPRPTDEEYTRYSFPSKNMEYMASGTPVLTTRLPGMPDEYLQYVYLIEDESEEGMTKTLKVVLNEPETVLIQKGLEAKNFVLSHKTENIQASKVLDLIKEVINQN